MHSREHSPFGTCRSGLWLVIDLIDDLLESDFDEAVQEDLRRTRGRVTDLLFELRWAEECVNGKNLLRLQPPA